VTASGPISVLNFAAEPRDLFETRLPTHLRAHCPHVFPLAEGGEGWAWTSEVPEYAFGADFDDARARRGSEPRWSYAQLPLTATDPGAQLAAMKAAGVDAVVVYPLALMRGYGRLGPEIRRSALSVYNDWMASDFEAYDRGRIIGPRLLPTEQGTETLFRAFERVAGTNARAIFLPSMPVMDDEDREAFWRDVADSNLTVCAAQPQVDESAPFTQLLASHPQLRIVAVPVHTLEGRYTAKSMDFPPDAGATLYDAEDPQGVPLYGAHFPRQALPPPPDHELASLRAARAFRFDDVTSPSVVAPRSGQRLRVTTMLRTPPEPEDATSPAIGVSLGSLGSETTGGVKAIAESARRLEEAGFSGIWAGDVIARRAGTRSLDPFTLLSIAATVTEDVELGTCIVQVPLRRRVELAHRALSLHEVCGGRFTFGVGAGSTQADFDAVGVPFETRFRELREAIPDMKALWRGERVNAACLYPEPAHLGGPPVLIGSWGGQWVEIAAQEADGWIASGTRTWRALDDAMKRFRAKGGTRAVVSTVFADLSQQGEPFDEDDRVHLACDPQEAARRLRRLAEIGFNDVIVNNLGPLETLPILAALGSRKEHTGGLHASGGGGGSERPREKEKM
jgi:alkanesulfonate monooxygenase SsuD/methylene tetrahydromethanopterin reductase-like flavin-dependent oxidoreductase (luciferase family)